MKRTAFTLIELLVVTATILLLMSLTAVAVSSARSSQRRNQTRVTILKINEVLTSQWRTYPAQSGSPAVEDPQVQRGGVSTLIRVEGSLLDRHHEGAELVEVGLFLVLAQPGRQRRLPKRLGVKLVALTDLKE